MNVKTKYSNQDWVWYMYCGLPCRAIIRRIDIGISKGSNEFEDTITIDYTVNPPNAEISVWTQRCESKVYASKKECLEANIGSRVTKKQPPKKVKA